MDIPVSFRENGILFPGRKRAMACTFQAGWPEAKTKKTTWHEKQNDEGGLGC